MAVIAVTAVVAVMVEMAAAAIAMEATMIVAMLNKTQSSSATTKLARLRRYDSSSQCQGRRGSLGCGYGTNGCGKHDYVRTAMVTKAMVFTSIATKKSDEAKLLSVAQI